MAAPLLRAAVKEIRSDPVATLVACTPLAADGDPIVIAAVMTDAGPVTIPFSAATVNV